MEGFPKYLFFGTALVAPLSIAGYLLVDWDSFGTSHGSTVLELRPRFMWIADSYAALDSRADQLVIDKQFDRTCLITHLSEIENIRNEAAVITRALPSMNSADRAVYEGILQSLVEKAKVHIDKADKIMDAIESKRPVLGSCI